MAHGMRRTPGAFSRPAGQRRIRPAPAAGVECIITSSPESACELTACAHLAPSIAPDFCHGLATADWRGSDTGDAPAIVRSWMLLPQTPGLGFPNIRGR